MKYLHICLLVLRAIAKLAAQDVSDAYNHEFEVVLWASDMSRAVKASILSCPYNVSIIGIGREWPYNGIKLKLMLEYLRQQTNSKKVVLFADSHDTLFQGGTQTCPTPNAYADLYWSHDADIILQADGGCGWASTRICGLYPHAEKPFLNSGVILSSVGALEVVLEEHLGAAEARGEDFEHDQAFWHLMYVFQHKLHRKGLPLAWRLSVDYNETHTGTSLTHFVSTADDIYEADGHLAYNHNDQVHYLGCIIHAQGQSGNLIQQDIQLKLLETYPSAFTAITNKRVVMYTPFARLRIQ